MATFLSGEWFDAVDKIRAEVGDVPTPPALEGVQINVTVTGHPDGEEINVNMDGGDFDREHIDAAPATLTIPFEIAQKMFVENDQQAGMQAFMAGQIQVEGDMSVVMKVQAAGPPSEEAKALAKKISEVTD